MRTRITLNKDTFHAVGYPYRCVVNKKRTINESLVLLVCNTQEDVLFTCQFLLSDP